MALTSGTANAPTPKTMVNLIPKAMPRREDGVRPLQIRHDKGRKVPGSIAEAKWIAVPETVIRALSAPSSR